MANTFELIASSTVGSGGAASFDFTTIAATYTDLNLVISGRFSISATYGYCTVAFNNSTANFSIKGLYGAGSGSAGSFTSPSNYLGELVGNTATSNTFGNMSLYIPNYAGSTNKSFSVEAVGENNATFAQMNFTAGLWSQTAAINRITVTPQSGTFTQYSTAYLYGVKNA